MATKTASSGGEIRRQSVEPTVTVASMIRRYWRLLLAHLRPQWGRVAALWLLLLVGIAFQLVNPQIVRTFIDRAIAGTAGRDLVTLALVFMGLAVARQVSAVVATYLAEQVGWTATNELRGRLAEHLLRLDMSFHKSRTPGELVERIDGDLTALSNFFSQFVIHIVGNVILIVGILVLLVAENLWIGLALTLFALVALAAMVGIQVVAIPWWRQMRQQSAEFHGFIGEQLGGTEDIRSLGAAPFVVRKFTERIRAWLPAERRGVMGWAVLWSTNVVVFIFGTIVVFLLGSRFHGDGTLTIGGVYLVFAYSELIRHPLEQMRTQMQDLQKAGASLSRIEDLFALRSTLDTTGQRPLPAGPLAVAFTDVRFAYDDGDEGAGDVVLDGVSFDVDPGRVLGVLGRTGSGKTTLARLLTRLYDPIEGTVRLADVPISSVHPGELRRRVGMVTQDVQLFRASVRDNLSFFDPTVADDAIYTALEHLGLVPWLEGLPDGLDTHLDAGGAGLSAGEAQLLALTRIFLRDPGVVVLDEASSRLDPATELFIETAIDRLLEGRTGIIIAHRLATVRRADDILILEAGRVAEYGSRRALSADPQSRFSHLLQVGLEEVLA